MFSRASGCSETICFPMAFVFSLASFRYWFFYGVYFSFAGFFVAKNKQRRRDKLLFEI
jgi:hypothetical protein